MHFFYNLTFCYKNTIFDVSLFFFHCKEDYFKANPTTRVLGTKWFHNCVQLIPNTASVSFPQALHVLETQAASFSNTDLMRKFKTAQPRSEPHFKVGMSEALTTAPRPRLGGAAEQEQTSAEFCHFFLALRVTQEEFATNTACLPGSRELFLNLFVEDKFLSLPILLSFHCSVQFATLEWPKVWE